MQSLNGPSSLMGYVIGGGPGRGGVALVLGVFVAVFASACGDGGDQTGTGGTGGAEEREGE